MALNSTRNRLAGVQKSWGEAEKLDLTEETLHSL